VTAAKRIFVTENEVNFLAFPDMGSSLVVWGMGYALDLLSAAAWMRHCDIHYWGDIDTHGFLMLHRLRAAFPEARSVLMNRETLLAHRRLWVPEDKPFRGELARLEPEERTLFDALATDQYGQGVRLEQERIPYGCLQQALENLPPAP